MVKVCCGLLSLMLLISSCGYHLDWNSDQETMTVPYACGDQDGYFTNALTEAIHCSGQFRIVNSEGKYLLQTALKNCREEGIGFHYTKDNEGNISRTIIPNESRYYLSATFSLIDCSKNCILLGPVDLDVTVDFDHEYDSSPNKINVFSQGQLTDIETARITVHEIAVRQLAKKIVDYLYAFHVDCNGGSTQCQRF